MATGDRLQQVQDYLSKSSHNSKTLNNTTASWSSKYISWFSKSKELEMNEDPSANAWFSEAQKDPCLPSLSKKQRVIGFIGCILMGTFCFSLASLYIPFLVLKARKFALLYSLGSLFLISSFSLLWGPMNHLKHLFGLERLPFTIAYMSTMLGTIYFAVWVNSTVFTVVCAVAQIISLVWYIISYIPGGSSGLKFFSKLFYSAASKTVSTTLPV